MSTNISFDRFVSESNLTNETNILLVTRQPDAVTDDPLASSLRCPQLVALAQCLIVLFTLLGNGLVVAAVASFRRLRSVTNYFVVSLAFADLAVALFVMPCSVIYGIYRTRGQPIYGEMLCYFWISSDVMCCTASILHLCVIAVDRYFAILDPLTYADRVSTRRPGFVIAAVWTCSAAISFVPICTGWFKDENFKLCDLNVNKVYAVVSSMTSFYCPLVVMVIVYTRIYCVARRQANEISRLEKSVYRNVHLSMRRNGRDLKAVRTLGTLMGLFCVSWLPFFVVYLINPFYRREHNDLDLAVTWLGYSNSLFNPCVYAFMNNDFRLAYRKLLLCQRSRHLDSVNNSTATATAIAAVTKDSRRLEKGRVARTLIIRDKAVDENIKRKHEF